MTVIDTSVAMGFLLGEGIARQLEALMAQEQELAAPDHLVFEVLAVLRREANRGRLGAQRACGAVEDLGEMSIEIFPCLPLRQRAWALRDNFAAADALCVTLAEELEESLATKDSRLLGEIRKHSAIEVMALTGSTGPSGQSAWMPSGAGPQHSQCSRVSFGRIRATPARAAYEGEPAHA